MTNPLTEKQRKLFSLFKIAIEEEQKAQKLYSDMLEQAEDNTLKEILQAFVEQEKKHEEILVNVYTGLRSTDEFKD